MEFDTVKSCEAVARQGFCDCCALQVIIIITIIIVMIISYAGAPSDVCQPLDRVVIFVTRNFFSSEFRLCLRHVSLYVPFRVTVCLGFPWGTGGGSAVLYVGL